MLKIQVNLPAPRRTLYLEAIARMHAVEPVGANPDALVTDTVPGPALPTLLDRPHEADPGLLSKLHATPLMPAHEWRFAPNIIPVQESRSCGQLGEPGLLRIHQWTQRQACPATLAFHQVDLSNWFFPGQPSSHYSNINPDYLQLHLGYPDSGMALIDIATSRPGQNDYYSMHLIGSQGAAYADDHENSHLLLGRTGLHSLISPVNEVIMIRNMLEEFVAGTIENRPWTVTLEDTLNALQTMKEVSRA